MLKHTVQIFMILVALLLAPPLVVGQEHMPGASHDVSQDPLDALPAKLRDALREEMRALEPAVARLAGALPKGEWQVVHDTAVQVRDSFILKQALTGPERETLHRVLPDDFRQRDAAFHEHAYRLALAAHNRDAELAGFYFARLTEGCMGCHGRYARQRFPGFQAAEPQHAH